MSKEGKSWDYITSQSMPWLEELEEIYHNKPAELENSWRYFFDGIEVGQQRLSEKVEQEHQEHVKELLDAYRRYGHLIARTNPLEEPLLSVPELDLERLGFKKEDLSKSFPSFGLLKEERSSLNDIVAALKKIYCGTLSLEYMECHNLELESWMQEQVESRRCLNRELSLPKKRKILHSLNRAELFEHFLHTKYVGQKRFSLEGAETLIPLLEEIVEFGGKQGIENIVLGMSHRGRLNVLTNVFGKSFASLFSEFEDYYDPTFQEGSGDVKYHRGFTSDIQTALGDKVHLMLTANPSHLESVDPVVLGRTKAKQILYQDSEQKHVLPILVHGDAALAGQGVIYECMQFYRLPGYATGGTIHIVVNNQIGFTTLPKEARSTLYCTDIARSFSAPIFHLNAEDPEACVHAAQLAIQIRERFKCDVFLELNCYRKYGHNEGDEPEFTQPLLYQKIKTRESVRKIYIEKLLQESAEEQSMAEKLSQDFALSLQESYRLTKERPTPSAQEAFGGIWANYRAARLEDLLHTVSTKVTLQKLQTMASKFCELPAHFQIHSKLKKVVDARLKMMEGSDQLVDWGMAEHLAFASLLSEGHPIRLSGQDVCRGTFSHRHAVWVDQKSGHEYIPLKHLSAEQGRFDIYNSPLSEFAVVGFEFGYSLSNPLTLVLWEAQFGDFANGAQIMIDQYIASAGEKWRRFSGLVLLLPHGYEGQGPEHSSARVERFLQLSGEANMLIVNPSTPAQYFHLLRRQHLSVFRTPLIVFTPKALLRHPRCVSSLEQFTSGEFQLLIDDSDAKTTQVKALLFCSGKIFYDLLAEKESRALNEVAIIRIEQLYPLDKQGVRDIFAKYAQAGKYKWIQEEPLNMGAAATLSPQIVSLLPLGKELEIISRPESAATASGSHTLHAKMQREIIERAFQI